MNVGENGSGKSTLLEAIAIHYSFGREGGSRNLRAETTESVHAVEPLVNALRVAFTKRTGAGFYLRAESFFKCDGRNCDSARNHRSQTNIVSKASDFFLATCIQALGTPLSASQSAEYTSQSP
jgi:predicted ATPase